MTIDKEQLIDLLTQKTGLEKSQTRERLHQLIARIKHTAEEGEIFQIGGLGTFEVKNRSLHFEPAERLETEINHKYAGMKPIELIGAFKETPVAEGIEVEESASEFHKTDPRQTVEKSENIKEAETAPVAQEEAPDDEKVTPSAAESEDKDESSSSEVTPPADEDEDEDKEAEAVEADTGDPDESEAEKEAGKTEPHEKKPSAAPVPASANGNEIKDDKAKEPVSQKDEEEKKEKPAGKVTVLAGKEKPEKSKRTAGVVAAVFIILVILGFTGWMVYEPGPAGSEISTENTSESTGSDQSAVPPGNPGNSPEESGKEATSENNAVRTSQEGKAVKSGQNQPEKNGSDPEEDQQQQQPESPLYGLKGETNSAANDGYTIIVHSFRTRGKILRLKNKLDTEGFRTIVVEADVSGKSYWRLGVGQFETVEAAVNTAQSLRDPFNGNHFIKRIQ